MTLIIKPKPCLRTLKKRPGLWLFISMSGRNSELLISYPDKKAEACGTIDDLGWVKTEWSTEEIYNDYFNGFAFLGYL